MAIGGNATLFILKFIITEIKTAYLNLLFPA